MKIFEIRTLLKDFNFNADFQVIVDNKPVDFEITFGTSEGVTKENCEVVALHVEGNNDENES